MNQRWAFSELMAPAPLAAVALMAINDRWLKHHFHNQITGKLSDLAVCFVLPLFLAALGGAVFPSAPPRRRLLVGALATTVIFTALELWPAAADLFCAANAWVAAWIGIDRPFHLTSDATDLLALVMVPAAYFFGAARARPGRVLYVERGGHAAEQQAPAGHRLDQAQYPSCQRRFL